MEAPDPSHIIRFHTSPITALHISSDNKRVYSGDSTGKVVVTSTLSLRCLASWNAHTDSILGVEEWNDGILTLVLALRPQIWVFL
jgi:ASTRA-associated protein 1